MLGRNNWLTILWARGQRTRWYLALAIIVAIWWVGAFHVGRFIWRILT